MICIRLTLQIPLVVENTQSSDSIEDVFRIAKIDALSSAVNNLKQDKQTDAYVTALQNEVKMLKADNRELSERNTAMSLAMSDLHTKIKEVESEKITALKLLQEDHENSCKEPSKPEIKTLPENTNKTEDIQSKKNSKQSHKQKSKQNKESGKLNQEQNGVHNNEQNRKVNQEHNRERNSDQDRKQNDNTVNASTATTGNQHDQSVTAKRLVFVAGDSIIQHVHGWELSDGDRHVAVKSFSGAKTEDMEDYLKPLIRKEPDEIILHVGTNNVREEDSARMVADHIVNLGI